MAECKKPADEKKSIPRRDFLIGSSTAAAAGALGICAPMLLIGVSKAVLTDIRHAWKSAPQRQLNWRKRLLHNFMLLDMTLIWLPRRPERQIGDEK